MTPIETLHEEKGQVNHWCVFGCISYAHVSMDERPKQNSKALKCVLLAYGAETKGYRLYDLETE